MLLLVKTLGLMILAAGCEVGGAYLIWQWQRGGKPLVFALVGLAALFGYAWLQTAQAFSFGRAFAAYGGIFILMALLWGWGLDGQRPDRWDWLGVSLCLVGVNVMLWMPRS